MISRILTVLSVFVSSLCLPLNAADFLNNEVIGLIDANKNTCVLGCTEDRIYLDPSKIIPTEHGVYLNVSDAEYILLPTLNSDSQGCFVPVIQILPTCPGCGYEYFISCTRPQCPLVQRKQDREQEKDRKKQEEREGKKNKEKK